MPVGASVQTSSPSQVPSTYDWLEYEEEEDGPVGPRSLVDFCQGVVIRCASRYDNVGALRYHQHPLFFQTMEAEQLAEIEDNSPEVKADTDHLWQSLVKKKDIETYKKYSDSAKVQPNSWRKVYMRLARKEEERRVNAAEYMKALYAQEQNKKSGRTIQLIDTPGPATPKKTPSTLLGKIRRQVQDDAPRPAYLHHNTTITRLASAKTPNRAQLKAVPRPTYTPDPSGMKIVRQDASQAGPVLDAERSLPANQKKRSHPADDLFNLFGQPSAGRKRNVTTHRAKE